MATSQLGLNANLSAIPAAAAFLGWGWFYSYCVLSSRTLKQIYGIDHNGNPRQDLARYADAAVREGKMTRAQVSQIQRLEAASANSMDGYAFFAVSVLFACVANVPRDQLVAACTTYSVARIVYAAVYVFVEHDLWSQFRGLSWWTGNFSCLYLLWKGAEAAGWKAWW